MSSGDKAKKATEFTEVEANAIHRTNVRNELKATREWLEDNRNLIDQKAKNIQRRAEEEFVKRIAELDSRTKRRKGRIPGLAGLNSAGTFYQQLALIPEPPQRHGQDLRAVYSFKQSARRDRSTTSNKIIANKSLSHYYNSVKDPHKTVPYPQRSVPQPTAQELNELDVQRIVQRFGGGQRAATAPVSMPRAESRVAMAQTKLEPLSARGSPSPALMTSSEQAAQNLEELEKSVSYYSILNDRRHPRDKSYRLSSHSYGFYPYNLESFGVAQHGLRTQPFD